VTGRDANTSVDPGFNWSWDDKEQMALWWLANSPNRLMRRKYYSTKIWEIGQGVFKFSEANGNASQLERDSSVHRH